MTIFGLHVFPVALMVLGLGFVALAWFLARRKTPFVRFAALCAAALIGLFGVGAGVWQNNRVVHREADVRYLLELVDIQVVSFPGVLDMDVTVRKDGCEVTFMYDIGEVDGRPSYPLLAGTEHDAHGNCARLRELFFVAPPW